MSGPDGTGGRSARREKIAAQRRREQRGRTRNRVLLASGAIVVIIVLVVIFVVLRVASPRRSASNGPTGNALAKVVSQVTTVPAATLDAVGAGNVTSPPVSINGPPLTSGGKPEMLYIGAEYCPFCAAERWGMIVALSRFGSFSGLRTVHSSSTDYAPNTPTFTFHDSAYVSRYVAFTPVEMTTNVPDSNAPLGYTPLQKPTAEQQALMSKFDAPPYVPSQSQGSIPFVTIGNRYLIVGSSYDPKALAGKSWSAIASSLKDPSSPVARSIDGTANYITAAICGVTGNRPAGACTPVVRSLESRI